jgi:hypothetical protein
MMMSKEFVNLDERNHCVTLGSNLDVVLQRNWFLAKALRINTIEERYFSLVDYPEIKPNNYKQYVYRNKKYLVKCGQTNPALYKVRGVDLPDDTKFRNPKAYAADTREFEELLIKNCKNQEPAIHDIRFKFDTDLYDILKTLGYSVNSNNHSIVLTSDVFTKFNPLLDIKLILYHKTAQMNIACTNSPILYNKDSLLSLSYNLGRYIEGLKRELGVDFLIQDITSWVAVMYHLNKDGSLEVQDRYFHYQLRDIGNALIRVYTKDLNGKRILRIEEEKSPQKTIPELIEEID